MRLRWSGFLRLDWRNGRERPVGAVPCGSASRPELSRVMSAGATCVMCSLPDIGQEIQANGIFPVFSTKEHAHGSYLVATEQAGYGVARIRT